VGQTLAQTSVAIASTTKLMTADLVVGSHPLGPGASGPLVTITAPDATLYQQEFADGDSVVRVVNGEQLSELQLLEGLLLPSGDNLAVVLAEWDAGSEAKFVYLMNRRAHALGMTQTKYADSSGVDPASVSTASDLTRLALAVMAQPSLAGILAKRQAVLPVAGVVRNYDSVLGQDGMVGMKTGWTSVAGGCFVFAATELVAGRPAELVGAMLGQAGNATTAIELAQTESVALVAATWPRLEEVHPVVAGQSVGQVRSSWQAPVPVRAARSIDWLGWPGLHFALSLRVLRERPPVSSGQAVAVVTAHPSDGVGRSARGLTTGRVTTVPLSWRLLRG
jgi:D-alanyl-D-alanine carboxypeptidase (penicillin-binding protein 5/6)